MKPEKPIYVSGYNIKTDVRTMETDRWFVTKGHSWRVVITRTPPASRVLPANRREWNSPGPHYRGNTGIQVLLRM